MRLIRLSSSKKVFNNHKKFYNEAMHNSSYKNELKHLETKIHYNNKDNILKYH